MSYALKLSGIRLMLYQCSAVLGGLVYNPETSCGV